MDGYWKPFECNMLAVSVLAGMGEIFSNKK